MLYAQGDALDLAYIRRWLGYLFPPDETNQEPEAARVDTRITLFTDLVEAVHRSGGRERG
ncbi:MAG: hypothetical protein HYX51_08450 [Chloroflexi bacterium]|nr:hypothetical protein [Chloroflexota bacterium]